MTFRSLALGCRALDETDRGRGLAVGRLNNLGKENCPKGPRTQMGFSPKYH